MSKIENLVDKYERMEILLRETGVEAEYISPSFVADIAYTNGIELSSGDIVFISDNYED